MSEFSNIPHERILGTDQGNVAEYSMAFFGAMDAGPMHPRSAKMHPEADMEIEPEDDGHDDEDDHDDVGSELELMKEGSGSFEEDIDDDGEESESEPSKDHFREEDGGHGSGFTRINARNNREPCGQYAEDTKSNQDAGHGDKEAGNLQLLSATAQSTDNFNKNVLPAQRHKDPENELKDSRIECDVCKMSFSSLGNYRRHVAAHSKDVRNEGEGDRSHSCPECGKSYLNKAHLKEHIQKHSNERPFQCPVCNKGFFRGPILKKHLEIHSATHPFVRSYEVRRLKKPKAKHACNVCGKVYPFKSRLEEHMMRHLGEKPVRCSICDKGFFRKGELKKHLKSHGSDYVVEEEKKRSTRTSPRGKSGKKPKEQCHTCVCKDCGKVMTQPQSPPVSKATLNPKTQTQNKSRNPAKSRNHINSGKQTKAQKLSKAQKPLKPQKSIRANQPDMVQSQQLVDESTDMRIVKIALDPSNNPPVYPQSDIVGEGSKQTRDIECESDTQESVEKADPIPKKRPPKVAWTKDDLTCQHCGKLFDTRKKWREHQKCHKMDKPFLCSICGKSFLSNGLYKNHLVSHSDEKPFRCDHCGQHFKQKFNLKHHVKMRHIASKTFLCHLCGNAYTSNSSLQIHLQIHSGEKPFHCEHCPKSFTLKSNLREHLRYHSEERPYKCSVCNADFRVSGTLKLHMRSHTGEKPYACSVCARTFAVKGTLKDHMRIHTGEKPHKCDVCGKQFSQKAGLYSHKKTHVKEIQKAMFVPPVFY